jgi:hypothetical protein
MTTIEKLESYLLITIDEDFKPKVEEFIASVTAYIERYTGRTFDYDPLAVATARLYDGNNTGQLFIDDALEVTEVKVKDTVLDEDDYILYPSNKLPKTRIILPYKLFYIGNQNITVTAKWGYGENIPDDLSFAATLLVADIINTGNTSGEGDIASETIGRYSVTYAVGSSSSSSTPEALNAHKILKMYRRLI